MTIERSVNHYHTEIIVHEDLIEVCHAGKAGDGFSTIAHNVDDIGGPGSFEAMWNAASHSSGEPDDLYTLIVPRRAFDFSAEAYDNPKWVNWS